MHICTSIYLWWVDTLVKHTGIQAALWGPDLIPIALHFSNIIGYFCLRILKSSSRAARVAVKNNVRTLKNVKFILNLPEDSPIASECQLCGWTVGDHLTFPSLSWRFGKVCHDSWLSSFAPSLLSSRQTNPYRRKQNNLN